MEDDASCSKTTSLQAIVRADVIYKQNKSLLLNPDNKVAKIMEITFRN